MNATKKVRAHTLEDRQMDLKDTIRLVRAIRDTADALREEADVVENHSEAAFLIRSAEACERRAAEMERGLPPGVVVEAAAW